MDVNCIVYKYVQLIAQPSSYIYKILIPQLKGSVYTYKKTVNFVSYFFFPLKMLQWIL